MLPGMMMPMSSTQGGSAIAILTQLNLLTGLKLCLDAGDAASYASGQSWLDLSGGGYDFFRGTTSGSESTDPTFNGTAGGLSSAEYWSFDGADLFTYDAANETWMNNIHKDNAKLWLAIWVWLPTGIANDGLVGDGGATFSGVGFDVRCLSGPGAIQFVGLHADGSTFSIAESSGHSWVADAWNFVGLSLDEAVGAGGLLWNINGNQSSGNSTYNSPSASNATQTLQLGARGNASNPLNNTSRLAIVMIGEGVTLTADQLAAIFNATRGRFGV